MNSKKIRPKDVPGTLLNMVRTVLFIFTLNKTQARKSVLIKKRRAATSVQKCF